MLVIRCREGESVSIGDDIHLSILAIDAGRVKLGFTAPAHVSVSRKCAELTREQNKGAANGIERSVLSRLTPYLQSGSADLLGCLVAVDEKKNWKSTKSSGSSAEE